MNAKFRRNFDEHFGGASAEDAVAALGLLGLRKREAGQIQHAFAHKGRADCLRFASPAKATMRLGGLEAFKIVFESQTVNVLKRMLDLVKKVIWKQFGIIWK